MPAMAYNILIHKYLTGEITPDENKRLEVWLAESHDNVKQFKELKLIWENSEEEEEVTDNHFHDELQKLQHAVEESVQKDLRLKLYKRSGILKNCTVAFLIIVCGIIWGRSSEKIPTGPFRFSNNHNNELLLSDSSQVSLNDNSSFSFNTTPDIREVSLSGEALFDVKREARPFIVNVENGSITVTGTCFIVKAYPHQPFEVIVISGSVKVTYHNQMLLLSARERSTINAADVLVKLINDDVNFDSWYTNKLDFKKASLDSVLKLLEHQYDAHFTVNEPRLLSCRFTGKFDNATLDEILQTLSFSLDLEIVPQPQNHYIITGQGCTL